MVELHNGNRFDHLVLLGINWRNSGLYWKDHQRCPEAVALFSICSLPPVEVII